jgi:hypothetical protein
MIGFNQKVIKAHGTNANWFNELVDSAKKEYEKENIDIGYLIGKLQRAIEFIETEHSAYKFSVSEKSNIIKE